MSEQPVPQLPLEMWEEIKPLFGAGFPNECVVAIRGDTWKQLRNISTEAAFRTLLHPEDSVDVFDNPPDLLIHSHPNGNRAASDVDIANQLLTDCNWGIVPVSGNERGDIYDIAYPACWGPTIPVQPLTGRSYLFGIRDCVSICWDYYSEQGAPLERFAYVRDPLIYPEGSPQRNQFTELPKQAGLVQVSPHERLPGDFVIMQINDANRYNHCAIYVGEGRYLHQMEQRLSGCWEIIAEEAMIQRYNFRFYRNPGLSNPR